RCELEKGVTMNSIQLIYDWNTLNQAIPFKKPIEICDETMRDGIQSPSVIDPTIKEKCELLSIMAELGITIANIGLPGAGPRAYNDVLALARFANNNKLPIQLNCAARTLKADIEPIARVQEEIGVPITAYCFLGASPIRQLVEEWFLDKLKKTTDDAIVF